MIKYACLLSKFLLLYEHPPRDFLGQTKQVNSSCMHSLALLTEQSQRNPEVNDQFIELESENTKHTHKFTNKLQR